MEEKNIADSHPQTTPSDQVLDQTEERTEAEETTVLPAESVETVEIATMQETEDEPEPDEDTVLVTQATEETTQNPEYATEEASKAMQIINLDSLIKRYLIDITTTKDTLRTHRQMLEDTCGQDAEYHEQSEKVKEENKKKQAIKQRIMKQANVAMMAEQIMDLREQIKEAEEALTAYVQQYKELSGTNQIIGDDGSIHEIVSKTKLVKKGKYRP